MSIDCHLKLDGVKGESVHKSHKDEIALLNWGWGVHNDSCTVGGGSAVGRGKPGLINCSKQYDSASPVLAKFCASGKHFATATLTMAKSGDGQQTFLTVKFKEVYISDVSINAAQDGGVRENVMFSYADIEFAYKPQKPDGSMGGEILFGWDTRKTETR